MTTAQLQIVPGDFYWWTCRHYSPVKVMAIVPHFNADFYEVDALASGKRYIVKISDLAPA